MATLISLGHPDAMAYGLSFFSEAMKAAMRLERERFVYNALAAKISAEALKDEIASLNDEEPQVDGIEKLNRPIGG